MGIARDGDVTRKVKNLTYNEILTHARIAQRHQFFSDSSWHVQALTHEWVEPH